MCSLTASIDSGISFFSGVDAMVHAIEAYTSKFKKNPLSDALAREALRCYFLKISLIA
jgi:alcohol dehydrogenase